MENKIFIIYTANNCGACNIFKEKFLDKVLNRLKGIVKIKHINVNLMTENPGNKVHPQLTSPKWFPSFYLFNESEYNNFNSDLSGDIIGGTFINGVMSRNNNSIYSFQDEYIVNWVLDILNKIKKSKKKIINTHFEFYTGDWYKLFE